MKPAFAAFSALAVSLLAPWCFPAQSPGLPPEWDVRDMLAALTAQTRRIEPLLAQLHPAEWVARGAPEAYVKQLEQLRKQIGYLDRTAGELSAEPDRMTKALETYLRLQSVEAMAESMVDAVRRYQNPAVADLIQDLINENAKYTQQLRDYLVELVAAKEAECKIANQEAQRCRSELIRQPAKPSPARGPRQ